MRKRYSLWTAAGVGLVFVLACVTVNIYFPEAAVKQAASEIESEIQKKAAEKAGQEAVKKIAVLPRDFEIEKGEITPSLKVRRANVTAEYQALIDAMYKEEAEDGRDDGGTVG
jgi:hypothetical protein